MVLMAVLAAAVAAQIRDNTPDAWAFQHGGSYTGMAQRVQFTGLLNWLRKLAYPPLKNLYRYLGTFHLPYNDEVTKLT